MRLLLVDDQREITESLKRSIDWTTMGVDEVCTAVSAKEAKLIVENIEVDILLTDIEMPDESGLELFEWVKRRHPDIIGIFLTSHADFSYAQEAIKMGGFDYILQPARYQDVANVVERAVRKSREDVRRSNYVKRARLMADQCDNLLELLFVRSREGNYEDSIACFEKLKSFYKLQYEKTVFRILTVRIVKFENRDAWNETLLKMVFQNVLNELFEKEDSVSVANIYNDIFCIMQAFGAGDVEVERWKDGIERFHLFINKHMDFKIAIYPETAEIENFSIETFSKVFASADPGANVSPEIFWEREEPDGSAVRSNEECIRLAEKYIHDNISRSISRAEVAEYLNFNEEYFSRLFKKYNGDTFKSYEVKERIKEAKKLLQYSRFSINIIASKVGYDNFSHFSKIFKQATGYTPQEYRQLKSQK